MRRYSNPRVKNYTSGFRALPDLLLNPYTILFSKSGGSGWTRTIDPRLIKAVL